LSGPNDSDDRNPEHEIPWELGEDSVEIEIGDVLDLHSFRPRDVQDVVREFLDAASDKRLRELRIIHGRGIGTQRRMVRSVLEKDARVVAFRDAPAEAGGWGATVVVLSD
jgi:dsDNA-specific endonuclease/ATPase MutS2